MTAPAAATIEREKDKLFVTDTELIRRLGVPEKLGRRLLRTLDDKAPSFPKKQSLVGNRRWWPAVEAYFARNSDMLSGDAARLATENRDRTRLPRRHLAVPRGGPR